MSYMEHIINTRPICIDSDGHVNHSALAATLDAILEYKANCMTAAARIIKDKIQADDIDDIKCAMVIIANYLLDNSKVE